MTYKGCEWCRGLTRYRTKDSIQQWREDNAVQAELRTSVENVLRLIYEEHYEVPFIATQRKQVRLPCKAAAAAYRSDRQTEPTQMQDL